MSQPVIDETHTAKRLSKDDPLLLGRREPVLIRPLRLLAHSLVAFLMSFDVLFQSGQHFSTEGAVVPLGNHFHLLQDVSRKADRERFDGFVFVVHASIIQQHWMRIKRLIPVPQPRLRNAPHIPVSEVRGFTARSDNS